MHQFTLWMDIQWQLLEHATPAEGCLSMLTFFVAKILVHNGMKSCSNSQAVSHSNMQ